MRFDFTLALVGNPNSGKSTIFNALTGLRQKVANYPGVTVEKREGFFTDAAARHWRVIDLPGSYSLSPRSLDEAITRDVLLGRRADTSRPDVIGVVIDASRLERNLFQVTQLIQLGIPVLLILNMVDIARIHRRRVDARRLGGLLGVPVVETVGHRGEGLDELVAALTKAHTMTVSRVALELPTAAHGAIEKVAHVLLEEGFTPQEAINGEALRLLSNEDAAEPSVSSLSVGLRSAVERARAELEAAGVNWRSLEADVRYAFIRSIAAEVIDTSKEVKITLSERIDAVLMHRFFGLLIFVLMMALVFEAVYSWSAPLVDLIDRSLVWLSGVVALVLPAGLLQGLIVDGIIGGVGAMLVFLPQIAFLFLFLAILEESGYLARAAFVMDKPMSKVGLHGKAFIPLLCSYACAIPGIMAARTMDNQRDRLLTIMIAPLMTCAGRLPVYALLIGAFIPATKLFGFWDARGFALFALYFLGIVLAAISSFILRKLVIRGRTPSLILEFPQYQLPRLRTVLFTMWSRTRSFVYRAGTVILLATVVLWVALNYPQSVPQTQEYRARVAALAQTVPPGELDAAAERLAASEQVRNSIAGRLGRLMEPVIRPLGFDWRMGVGLIGALAAREVFVATLGVVYSTGDHANGTESLRESIMRDTYPDGSPVWTPLVAASLLVFFAVALLCIPTIAVVWHETGGWKWTLIQFSYMLALAWLLSFAVYQGGKALGWS